MRVEGIDQIVPVADSGSTTLLRGVNQRGERCLIRTLRLEAASGVRCECLDREYRTARRLGSQIAVVPSARVGGSQTRAIIYPDPGVPLLAEALPGPFPVSEALKFGLAMCRQLTALNEHRMLHLALSPWAIWFDRQSGWLRLGDFFDARQVGGRLAQRGAACSDPTAIPYRAPEQTGRLNLNPDRRADLYALGLLLYEMLVGRRPFESDDPSEWIHWHLAVVPPSPHDARPSIPRPLSDIVMKLIAKEPDARYRTTVGLARDLRHCRNELTRRAAIEHFELAAHDFDERFEVPERVLGRDEAFSQLAALHARTDNDCARVALIKGPPGIGKSALAQSFEQRNRPGRTVSGKFEQFSRNAPYHAIAQALGQLAEQLAALPESELDAIRAAVKQELGASVAVLVDLVPGLAVVLGEHARPPMLGPIENRNRLNAAVRGLFRLLATAEMPLVIVLDDLQWVDDASLELLVATLPTTDAEHLVIVGCYRDTEVRSGHPLLATLSQLDELGVIIEAIEVAPLPVRDLQDLVAGSLLIPAEHGKSLAEHLHRRSGGTPFDARQLLHAMRDQGHIEPDADRSRWRWRGPRPDAADQEMDVVALIRRTIEALPSSARALLELGMCLGNRFHLETLSVICEEPADALAAALQPAVDARVLVADHDVYHFAHDRTQQAVVEATPESAREAHNARIGWRLLAHHEARDAGVDEHLFSIVNHLNRAPVPNDASRLRKLVALNLAASRRAYGTTAYTTALHYGETATGLAAALDRDGPIDRLVYESHLELARALYHTGAFETARDALMRAEATADSIEDRVAVYALLKDILVSEGTSEGYREAVRTGIAVLEDITPGSDRSLGDDDVDTQLTELLSDLERTSAEKLAAVAQPANAPGAARMRLLVDLWEAAYYAGDAVQMQLATIRMVRTSLALGNTTESAMAYVIFGMVLLGRGDVEHACAYGNLGIELNRRFADRIQLPKVTNLFCNYINHFQRPFANSAELYDLSASVGRENGDHLFGLWAAFFSVWTHYLSSDRLADAMARSHELDAFVVQTKDAKMIGAYRLLQQTIADLMEPRQHQFVSQIESAESTLTLWREQSFLPGPTWLAILRGQAAYIYGNYREALDLLTSEDLVLAPELVMFPVSQMPFYRAASAAALWHDAPEHQRERLHELSVDGREELAAMAKHCPANFAWQWHLLRAETHRIEGDRWAAGETYELAIEAADRHGPIFARAVSHEAAGRFWLAERRPGFARLHLDEALSAFEAWGARSKAEELRQRVAEWLPRRAPAPAVPEAPAPSRDEGPESELEAYDLNSLMKAAEAIAGVTDVEQLLGRTLQIAMEIAGARRGVFLVLEDGSFRTRAVLNAGASTAHETLRQPLDDYEGVPRSILRRVAKTRCEIVSGDAIADPEHAKDPYVTRNETRSALCVPLVYQGAVTALLYLENNLAADVFTAPRLEVLRLVLAQLATSLEITRLFEALVEEMKQRSNAEEALAASEFRLRRSHDFAGIGVWDWDVLTGDIYWSERTGPIHGYPEGELRLDFDTFAAGLHPDDREGVEADIRACFEGAEYRTEHRIIRPDGEMRWVQASGDVIRDDEGRPVRMLGIVQDITERVEGESERRRLERQLQQAQKMEAIGELTGGIAHDFNNILGIAVGFAESAIDDCGAGRIVDVPESLQHVLDASLRAKSLIEKLLAFSRTQVSRPKSLALGSEVEKNLEMLSATLPSSIRVSLDVEPGLPTVLADPVDLNQLIVNCCINAHQAMGGSGRLALRARRFEEDSLVCTSCHEAVEGPFVELSIQDSGIGMSEEVLDRIFEPFFTTKKTGEGSGMGLAMVHGVLHRLGGHVLIESTPGEGTCVRLLLPISGAADLRAETREERADAQPVSGVRVLVVDDEPALAKFYRRVLTDAGCEVALFSDPTEALRAFETAPETFDLVLTDFTMPEMTGLELARGVSEADDSTPIILCTGGLAFLDLEEQEDRFHAVLEKPVRKAALLDCVRQALQQS